MQCLHCAHPHYILYGTSHVVQLCRYHACQRISDATTWQRSSPQATGLSTLSGRDDDASYRPGSQLITRRYLAGQSKLPKHSQQAHHRPKPAPSSKSRNSKLSSLKKSQFWPWLAVDSIFGKVLGFVCGRGTIKTGGVLWKQIKNLPTIGYGTEYC